MTQPMPIAARVLLAELIREANPGEHLPEGADELLAECDHNIAEECWELAPKAAQGDVPALARLRKLHRLSPLT